MQATKKIKKIILLKLGVKCIKYTTTYCNDSIPGITRHMQHKKTLCKHTSNKAAPFKFWRLKNVYIKLFKHNTPSK
jgi:hypothetical protein